MNLETVLEGRLWEAVRSSVEARNYKGAILDAIHLLTDVVRQRSGLEGDGVALIGAAFGGNSPKLKVNRLRTESERNIQRGIEMMLRGLYQAIRNPRSHEPHQDNERDANALLLLVDYLLRVVDQSGSPFSLPTLVARVFDPDFFASKRYAQLLVAEIPRQKRLATCREVFARRAEADNEKVRFFFEAVLAEMSPEETAELSNLISEELRQTNDEDTIRFVLCAFPSSIWPGLAEIARLRIENKLIASVKQGKWIRRSRRCSAGALGTYIQRIILELTLKDDFWWAVFNKLDSSDQADQDYALNYFMWHAERCFEAPPERLALRVNQGLQTGDARFRELAKGWQFDAFEERNVEDPWKKPFIDALEKFEQKAEAADMVEEPGPEMASGSEIPF